MQPGKEPCEYILWVIKNILSNLTGLNTFMFALIVRLIRIFCVAFNDRVKRMNFKLC